jgi:hypothetical protein
VAGEQGGASRPPADVFRGAIPFCLMVKVLFGLPLRQIEPWKRYWFEGSWRGGMVASILEVAGLDWPVPDFSTLSRRQRTLVVQILHHRAAGPLNLLVDNEAQAPSVRAPRQMGSSSWVIENGWPASTAHPAGANPARLTWPWTQPPATSEGWNSPQVTKVTAHSSGKQSRGLFSCPPHCLTCWIRSPDEQVAP